MFKIKIFEGLAYRRNKNATEEFDVSYSPPENREYTP